MGVAALVVGLLAGIAVGRAVDGGDDVEPALRQASGTRPPSPSGPAGEPDGEATTTTGPALTDACLRTIRSAEQALVLLDEGLQSLSELAFEDVEDVLGDMERLRDGFARRAQECIEDPQVGADGQRS